MSSDYTDVIDLPTPSALSSTDDIQWALDEFNGRRDSYLLTRDYYDGKHRLAFASEKLGSAFGKLFKAFADNLMPTVVETVKDRLKLDGFTVPGPRRNDGTIQTQSQPEIDEIWRRNRLLVRANQVHLDSLIEGDSYVVVWPDATENDFPTFYPNNAREMVIGYDIEKPGYIVRAAKCWEVGPKDKKQYRLTLYFRDRIEKYITRNTTYGLPELAVAFIPHVPPGETWPIINRYDKVPVFHFGNRVSIGMPGCSELKEAILVQDALNKSIADMLVAGEFYGVPQRYVTGLEDEAVIKEAERRFKLIAGGLWGTSDKDAKFGEFPASDISKFILVSETFRKEIARVSRTPLHFFAMEGTLPSGESMKTAEAPLLSKVTDRQESWGAVWSDAMRFALQIANFGDFEPQPKWIDTTPRNDTETIQNAATKVTQLQIPYEQVWRELGYTEEQITLFATERLQRQQQQIELQRAKFAANPTNMRPGDATGTS